MNPLQGESLGEQRELEDRIRHRVVGLLHVGRAGPGVRLPSIRETARQTGADHRAVAAAYRTLEEEGLVEIRPGSGVYVAEPVPAGPGPLEQATARLLANLLTEGWQRALRPDDLLSLLRGVCVAPMRVAVVESVEDALLAVGGEMSGAFGLEVVDVLLDDPDCRGAELAATLPAVDLVLGTAFHAEQVRALAEAAGTPCVVATVHTEFAARFEEAMALGPVTGVVKDPRMAERTRRYMGVTAHGARIDVRLADQVESLQALAAETGRTVLATAAAREALGEPVYHIFPPPPPYLSRETAEEVHRIMAGVAVKRALTRYS